MEPVIHLREAVALLGRFPALTGATLEIGRGEVVLLRGSNGAGKTTLLRLCAGLVPVTSGEAMVLGHDLCHDRRAVRPRVGLLAHSNHLYGDLTAVENVRFWGAAAGAGATEADVAVAAVGLTGRLARTPVSRLSAGQRRRTALAVLVARRPELWLLDEPHAGLDADGRDLLDDLIRRAVEAGATVLFASHELDRSEPLAHRTVTMVGGRTLERLAPARATPEPTATVVGVPC